MDFPDFWHAIGLRIVSTEAREVVLEMDVPDWLMSPFGAVHGGAVAMLLDTALAMAIHRELDGPNDRVATHQLAVTYVSFATERPLRCHARRVSLSRTVAVAEGEVQAPGGTLVAKALGTFAVRRRAS